MAITDSDLDAVYKKYYGNFGVEYVGMSKAQAVFVGRCYKEKKFRGKQLHSAVEHNDVQNASHTASTTLGNTDGGDDVAFTVTLCKDFNHFALENFALEAAKKDGSLSDVFTLKMNGLIRQMYLRLEQGFFGSFGGWIGIVSAVSTDTVTLTRASDARWFRKDMEIVSSENDGTGSAHALQAGSATVSTSDATPGVGTVVATANWATGIASIDAGDYLFKAGDFKLAWFGLPDWVPASTTNLSTSFLGVTRSNDPTALAGSRKDYTGESIFGAMQQMDAIIASAGGVTTDAWMNPFTFERAINEARASGLNMQPTSPSGRSAKNNKALDVGFDAINVWTGYGNKTINKSIGCPDNLIYLGNMSKESTVAFHLGKEMVNTVNNDGNVLLREADNFSVQVRAEGYNNLCIRRAIDWGVITTDSPS